MRHLTALLVAALMLAGAAPIPPKPPAPDLATLVPWAAAPLDKPPIEMPRLTLPPPPAQVPPVVLVPLIVPAAPKPTAPVPGARALPCVGAWLRIASESLECGRARFAKGELDDAAKAFEQAVRGGTERDVVAEARYWYGETLYRLNRFEDAEWQFRQVVSDPARAEFGPWAMAGHGWTALRLGDGARAQEAFTRLFATAPPAPLDSWGRHGLAMALYAQGRNEEAEKVWAELLARRPAAGLERDVVFWHGEVLGRIGQYDRAAQELTAFTQGGAHPLLSFAHVRLGWWRLHAGQASQSAAAFRAFLTSPPSIADAGIARERDWAEAGLALALVAAGDWDGARQGLRGLDSRRSPLTVPIRLRLAAAAADKGQAAAGNAVVQELLGATLTPAVRAWVLLVKGDALRAEGNRDEARTQFELARNTDPTSETGRHALLRLAQSNFELREFSQAASDVAPLLTSSVSPDMRAAALLLQGEAAYHAGDYAKATAAYRRALVEFPGHASAPAVRLALAWSALRGGQRDDALQQFREFARVQPADPHAVDALVLASELTLAAGSLDAARELLDRIIATYPRQPRSDFARLNRALLLARTGQAPAAQKELREWITRAPFPPLLGRAYGALGATLLAAGRPAEAVREFARAQQEGFVDFAKLGLGAAALTQERWDDAVRDFTEARDTGTERIAAAAEYGLAAVAFQRGKVREFKQPALAALDAAPRGPAAPRLLYVLTAIGVEDKDWPSALGHAKRLITEFPGDEAADDALVRVGTGAAEAGAWPVALEALTLLREKYPQSPLAAETRVILAQALIETGRGEDGTRILEEFVAASPNDPRAAQAWIAVGRAREAAGDRQAALAAFSRATQVGAPVAWSKDAILAHARVLLAEKRWADARATLDRLLRSGEATSAAEAAVSIGDAWEGQGDSIAAAEYYLTAAYLAPTTLAGRRALLAAGRSLAAAKQGEGAGIAYRKLLAQTDVPADLADAARRGLAELRLR